MGSQDNIIKFCLKSREEAQQQAEQHHGSAEVIELKRHKHVDQVAQVREVKARREQNQKLVQKRFWRIETLKAIYAQDHNKYKGVLELEDAEKELAQVGKDSHQGLALQYNKSMIALFYGLPLEYIEADGLSSNVEANNETINSMTHLITALEPDSEELRIQNRRIESMKVQNNELVAQINRCDKQLAERHRSRIVSQKAKEQA